MDYALSKPGLIVVIDAHHEKSLKTQNRHWVLERLWQDIADMFRDSSPRLIYEILNEPHNDDLTAMAPGDLRNMTAKAYAKIRLVDAKRIIIVGGNQWFAADEMAKVWPNLDQVGAGKDEYGQPLPDYGLQQRPALVRQVSQGPCRDETYADRCVGRWRLV